MAPQVSNSPTPRTRWRIVALSLLPVYFAFFARDVLPAHFAPDDMMNLGFYWKLKPLKLLSWQFLPWRGFYRPMAGLYYSPLWHLFGFRPAVFHVVELAILLGAVFLLYRLARQLGTGELPALFAAMALCYHAGVANLYYNTAFVYDVLCLFFYLGALVYYIGVRQRGLNPSAGRVAAFTGLFLCALNSKEMAITLPVAILLYEWTFRNERWTAAWSWKWLKGPGLFVIAAGILNVLYLYGKLLRRDALVQNPAYKPVFSFQRFLDFQQRSWGDYLLAWDRVSSLAIVELWLITFYLAWRRPDRPVLRFCWWMLIIAPLPIEFLEGRGQACLAIPLCAFIVFAATLFVDTARALSRVLARERLFSRFREASLFAALCGMGAVYWAGKNIHLEREYIRPAMAQLGKENWEVIQEIQRAKPRARPHSVVVFLNDPFDTWDMAFIGELWFHDPTIQVKLARKTPMSAEEIAKIDHVLTFEGDRIVQLR